MMKKTKEGLPVVSEKTREIFWRDFEQRTIEGAKSYQGYVHGLVEKLAEENFEIVKTWMEYIKSNKLEERDFARLYMAGAMTTYELLKRQAQADDWEEMLG